MKYASTLACISLAGFLGTAQAADCSRDDIDHYLDRGFSPKQVLELCRSGGGNQSLQQASQNSQQLDALRATIDARDISLDQDTLSFQRELCVKYDRPDFAQQRKKACGTARYQLARKGLQVEQSNTKLLFWGRNEVLISSPQVERSYNLGQEALSQRNQRRLQKVLDKRQQDNTIAVPVRAGVAISAARQQLQDLSQAK